MRRRVGLDPLALHRLLPVIIEAEVVQYRSLGGEGLEDAQDLYSLGKFYLKWTRKV